jgi:hypothetical protein
MKHLVLFEEYNTYIDKSLTRGQKIAISANRDLLNIGQSAVAYVLALDSVDSAASKKNADADINISRMIQDKYGSINSLMDACFGREWKKSDFNRWVKGELSSKLGIKQNSLIRARNKMAMLIKGGFKGTKNEVIYDVIIGYFRKIENMPREELVEFVQEYMKNPSDDKYDVK